MKIKVKANLAAASLAMFFLWAGSACAANVPSVSNQAGVPNGAVVVATVSIFNAQLVSQEGNHLKVSFDLDNRDGIQTGVKYSVELLNEGGTQILDRVIYQETITLGENQTVHKEVDYNAPDYLKGKFQVWVISRNEEGLSLAQAMAGEVSLLGTDKYIKIDSSSCYLRVSGDDKTYNLIQGVDVLSEEELSLHCLAANNTGTEMLAVPGFKTNLRTAFGKLVSEEKGNAIKFKSGEKKSFDVVIPKAQSPQAYEVNTILISNDGKVISNLVTFHYVIRGSGAAIQNVTLDKDSYAKGDTALVSLFWSGRADNFPGARQKSGDAGKTFLKIRTLQADGSDCADVLSKELNQGAIEKAEIAIKESCANGKMIVSLADEKGNALDEKVVEFRKVDEKDAASAPTPAQEGKKNLMMVLYLLAGIIFLVGLGAVIIKKNKGNNMGGTLLLLLLFGTLLCGKDVKAVTFYAPMPVPEGYTATFNANLNRNTFCEGETIIAYMDASHTSCANRNPQIASKGNVNDQDKLIITDVSNPAGTAVYRSQTYAGPNVVGNNYPTFFEGYFEISERINHDDPEYDPNHNYFAKGNTTAITYNVVSCPVLCGSASAQSYSGTTPPATADLCVAPSAGTNNTLALNALGTQWNWDCFNFKGASVHCTAPNNPSPIGNFGGATNSTCRINGYAFDRSNLSKSIQIHVYKDGPAGSGAGSGTAIGSFTADRSRSDIDRNSALVNDPLNLDNFDNYGFNIDLSSGAGLNDGAQHSLYVYAIDEKGNTIPVPPDAPNVLLPGSPRNIQCCVPSATKTYHCTPDSSTCSGCSPITLKPTCSYNDGCTEHYNQPLADCVANGFPGCVQSTLPCSCDDSNWRETQP